jgi:hypothetical protein
VSRSGTEKRRLPGQVLVRLTAEQQAAVATAADSYNVSAATFVREIIAVALKIDAGPIVKRTVPPEIVLDIARLREVVAELGGAMVQASIAAREDGRPVEHETIESLLPDIKKIADELLALKDALWRAAA